jgi:hypothetical protein
VLLALLVDVELLLEQLAPVHLRVEAAVLEKLTMRAALDDAPFVEDEDLVRILDGRDAVRNYDAGAFAHHAAHAAEYFRLRVRVHRRQRVVEDEDARILRDRACDRGALLLSSRQGHAALADHRVVARREVLDVFVELRDIARPVELRIGELLIETEAHVLAQRDREQEGLLGHVADGATELLQGTPPDVDAVDEDLALLDVEEPWDEIDDRRFAGPGRPDDRERSARGHLERNVVQLDGLAVREADASELDLALDRRGDGIDRIGDLGHRVEDLLQPAERGPSRLEHVGDPADIDHRHLQEIEVRDELHERPDGQLATDRVLAAYVEDGEHGDPEDEADRRPDESLHHAERDGAAEVLMVHPGEVLRLRVLLRERFHDADAGEVLLRLRRHVAELRLKALEPQVNGPPDVPEGERGERHEDQRDHRELERHRDHRQHREREHHDREGPLHDPRAHHLPDPGEVVRHARHQVADPLMLEIGEVHALEMREEVVAHAVLGLPRGVEHDVARAGAQHGFERREENDQ